MKRFSRSWFTQIMIHKLLKRELDQLKKIIVKETNVNYNLSYGDVITFLINDYKKIRSNEHTIEQKFYVSVPLQKKSINVSTKLDGKQRFSYSLES